MNVVLGEHSYGVGQANKAAKTKVVFWILLLR